MDMNKLTNTPVVCKAKAFFKSLSDLRIKKDYDTTITLYDKNTPDAPECTHNIKGSSDHSLMKMLAIVGVVSITLSAICSICSLFKD